MKNILLLSLLLIPACGKNQDTSDTGATEDPITQSVHGKISGIVENQSGEPIANVEVSINDRVALTAEDGTYTILDVTPDSNIVLKFIKSGYASNYEVTTLINWETVTSNTTLMEIDGSVTFSSTEASQISVDEVTVDFQAESFVNNETNLPYTGAVTVEITHVDPSTNEIDGAPRDLSAIGDDGSSQLVSYGMVDITLYGESGELLSITSDKPANVMIPITNGVLSEDYQLEVGDSQSTWSFDPTQGIWVEESTGLITGDENGLFFTFEAPHFSWWNCDQGFVPSCATGRVIDYLEFPVRSAEVTCAGDQTTSTTTTNEEGYYVCSVMVGDYVSFTGTTFVGGRTWQKTKGSIYMDSEGSSAADCEPIPDIQIDVCRIAGSVNVENYDATLNEDESATVSADGLSAVFWEPPGDISYCVNPLDSLQTGECWSGTNDEMVAQFPPSAFPGIPASARSAGVWLEVSSERNSYRMERSLEGVLPYYVWESNTVEDGEVISERPDFNQGDLISVSAAGDYNDYFGPWTAEATAIIPNQALFSNNSLTVNGGNLLVDYRNDASEDVFFSARVGEEQVLCRFDNTGTLNVPASALSGLPAGFGGAAIFNLSLEASSGPDGLPIYTQVFSGESVSLTVE